MSLPIQPLDACRLSILEHYRVFRQMKQEESSIWSEYLFPVVATVTESVLSGIRSQNAPCELLGTADPDPDHTWADFWFARYAKWKGSDAPLFQVGIEGLDLGSIFAPDADSHFQTYLYCSMEVQKVDDRSTRELFRAFHGWNPPAGFVRPEDKRSRQYILVRGFDLMTPTDFGNPSKLADILSEPVNCLLNWILSHWEDLVRAVPLKGK